MDVSRIGIHESVSAVFPPERLADELASVDPEVSVVSDDDLDGVDAVVTFEHRDAFLDAVEWVHSIQAGVDRFPIAAFERRGVALTNSTGIHGESVGETVAGMMLMLARRLHQYARQQPEHRWERPAWDEAFTLRGLTCCVVGLGTLGQGIARAADGLGMRVTGVKRTPESVEHVREVYASDDLHDAIADADFVALAVPLNDATEGFVGADEFAVMRDDAYLVNVARGPVVVEDELVAALRDGDIAGAALDVFAEEPLPADSPLWDFEDVIVTPHCAAFTRDYYRDIADLVRQNVRHLDAGEEWVNRVV
jgi:D-2-hydroxyacid dehydrogenase (NADP+)